MDYAKFKTRKTKLWMGKDLDDLYVLVVNLSSGNYLVYCPDDKIQNTAPYHLGKLKSVWFGRFVPGMREGMFSVGKIDNDGSPIWTPDYLADDLDEFRLIWMMIEGEWAAGSRQRAYPRSDAGSKPVEAKTL